MKKLSDAVDKQVVKKQCTKKTKNNFEHKIPATATLIHINQDTNKQNLEKRSEDVDKKHKIQVV